MTALTLVTLLKMLRLGSPLFRMPDLPADLLDALQTALKTLMVLHRLMRETDISFMQEVGPSCTSRGLMPAGCLQPRLAFQGWIDHCPKRTWSEPHLAKCCKCKHFDGSLAATWLMRSMQWWPTATGQAWTGCSSQRTRQHQEPAPQLVWFCVRSEPSRVVFQAGCFMALAL